MVGAWTHPETDATKTDRAQKRSHTSQHPHDGLHDPSLHRSMPLPQHPPATPPWCEQHPRRDSVSGDETVCEDEKRTIITHALIVATSFLNTVAPPDLPAYDSLCAACKARSERNRSFAFTGPTGMADDFTVRFLRYGQATPSLPDV
jgi:hypothetical protein